MIHKHLGRFCLLLICPILFFVETSGANTIETFIEPVSMEQYLLFYVGANMAEQDVFKDYSKNSDIVYRAAKADRDMLAPLYYPAKPVAHSSFNPNNIGLHPLFTVQAKCTDI